MAEGPAGLRQFRERRGRNRARLDPVVEPIRRRLQRFLRRTARLRGDVHNVDDVAGLRGSFRQRPVRLLAGPCLCPDRERPPVALGENHVVHDHLRRDARQIVEQRRVDHPRPRPAPDQRLQVPHARLVDRHENDVLAGRGRVGGPLDPPVVGLALECVDEWDESEERRRGGGGETDGRADEDLAHCAEKGSTGQGSRLRAQGSGRGTNQSAISSALAFPTS